MSFGTSFVLSTSFVMFEILAVFCWYWWQIFYLIFTTFYLYNAWTWIISSFRSWYFNFQKTNICKSLDNRASSLYWHLIHQNWWIYFAITSMFEKNVRNKNFVPILEGEKRLRKNLPRTPHSRGGMCGKFFVIVTSSVTNRKEIFE